jgi:glucose/mannose-6-phosphate isomerase
MEYIELIREFPLQLKGKKPDIVLPDFKEILFCGMGGSGIVGTIAKDVLNEKVFVCKCYDIPKFVSQDTLVFCISYSGNTEETLECAQQSIDKNAKVICVSSGGKLQEFAEENNLYHIAVPKGFQPRAATGYLIAPILKLFGKEMPDIDLDLEKHAESIAKEIGEKMPVVYTNIQSVGLKWQQEINENSKMLCVTGIFPELTHNQINAFTQKQNVHVILLNGDINEQNKKRFLFFEEQLKKQGISYSLIDLQGDKIKKILDGMILGSFVSYFLAVSRKKDPFNVEIIESLKKSLK